MGMDKAGRTSTKTSAHCQDCRARSLGGRSSLVVLVVVDIYWLDYGLVSHRQHSCCQIITCFKFRSELAQLVPRLLELPTIHANGFVVHRGFKLEIFIGIFKLYFQEPDLCLIELCGKKASFQRFEQLQRYGCLFDCRFRSRFYFIFMDGEVGQPEIVTFIVTFKLPTR